MIRRHALRLGAPMLVIATLAGACSSSKSTTSTTAASAGSTTTSGPPLNGTLNGSGSTFQAAYNGSAVDAFTKANKGVTINYNPTGSGQGQTDLQNQVVDFAGSDVPVASADLPKFKGGSILYFPTVLGPITVSFNLSGVTNLQLSGSTVAKIFAGSIKKWNDAAVAADNPGATLPSTSITIVHRSDGSGTTSNFTAYLKAVDPTDWTLGSGKTVNWPTSTQAGKGNAGVAQIVKSTSGAVGYVDFSDAKSAGLSTASVKNAAGSFIAPSTDAASAAAASATVNADLTYNPINTSGAQAYPIVSPTYIIVYAKQTDAAKGAALKAFLKFILGPDGQALASTVNFAPLPTSLATKALAQVDTITGA
ncbi:MAG TPA: phosphate ABC transporter substrate-binding protein PstS [Acidimicrobiales bacterium]|nr:phosphate ABC transporter substrate-binding protein PstS [Acidimicrobiales bacterium]